MRLFLAALALLAADLVLALLHPSGEASAGTAERLDLSALAQQSELIVEARVLSARAVDVEALLATEYLLEVARTFKGRDEAYRAVRMPGGVRADGSGLLIPGLPRFVPGEEALLFLSQESANGLRMPTGLAQGKLGIQRLASGEKRLVHELHGVDRIASRSVLGYAECVAELEAALHRSAGPGIGGR